MKFFTAAVMAIASWSCVLAAPQQLLERQSSKTPTPLTPAVASEGSPLMIQWTPTSNAEWSSMEVKFMTGANQNMTELFTIASGVDGTTSGPGQLLWTAPSVNPNSAIYFLQFTHSEQDPTWTTRFAVANADGQTTSPPYSKQPEGSAIPWGNGKLVSAVTASGSSSSASSPTTSSASTSTSSSASDSETASASSSDSDSATTSSASAMTAAATSNTGSASSSSQSSSAASLQAGSAAVLGLVVAIAACLTL